MDAIKMRVQRLRWAAVLPEYQSAGAACFDLAACLDEPEARQVTIPPGGTFNLNTGLAVEVPAGHAMLIYSRSGHGFKNGVRLVNSVGVIDSDYRGEIGVKLRNDSGEPFTVSNGQRIAQAMLVPIPFVTICEAEELTNTERGAGGFGSTGN